MPRTRTARLCALAASLVVLMACNFLRRPSTAPAPAPATAGLPIAATPIRLTLPAGLAASATAENIEMVTDQTGAPWDVAPAHLQLTLQGYPLPGSVLVPQVFVYPAREYAGANLAAAESLRRLESLVRGSAAEADAERPPRVPFFNAGQVIAAQQKSMQFSGGSGLRFITQYGQDVSPVNDSGLFYLFQGLSDNDKYYVIAILPVSLPFLPADGNPASLLPAGGVPFPAGPASGSQYENYFNEITGRIEAASAETFSPPLGLLDALVQSISIDR